MDWREEQMHIYSSARTVVVKAGSAVLSDQSDLNLAVLSELVRQLAVLQRKGIRVILVSSGAVAAGRMALSKLPVEIHGLYARQAAAAVGQGRLMQHYEQEFARHNVLTAQVLLTRDDLRNRQRFFHVRNTFTTLLDWGVAPVVNENDTVCVDELCFTDNDNLASLLLNVTEAQIFINLTTIGGVLDKNPLIDNDAAILPCIENIRQINFNALCGGTSRTGTGGMYTKLLAAGRAAQLGVPTHILPGREPDVILRAFSGETLGTWIRPHTKKVPRRKYWLAYQSDPRGTVHIDAGACDALENRGKSLLPVGITSVEGSFKTGELLRIVHNGRTIGVGLSNYDARTLTTIIGRKRHEVAALLGNAHYPDAIYRDNLLIDATLD
jgi:glutamate 5-kinase